MNYEELEELGFSTQQINQLLKIQKNGGDISIFKPDIPLNLLRQIAEYNNLSSIEIKFLIALNTVNDSETFKNFREKLNNGQKKEITTAINTNFDYKYLLDKGFSARKMENVRKGFNEGLSLDYLESVSVSENSIRILKNLKEDIKKTESDFDLNSHLEKKEDMATIRSLYIVHKLKLELPKINIEELSSEQIDEIIRISRKDHLLQNRKYECYLKRGYEPTKIRTLYQMDLMNFPVEDIKKEDYNFHQLNIIKQMYSYNFDYKSVLNKNFNSAQLEFIYRAMKNELDFSKMLHEDMTASYMKRIFESLKFNKNSKEEIINIDFLVENEIEMDRIDSIINTLKQGTLEDKLKIYKEYETKHEYESEKSLEK